jgi:hypothetical protein
MHPDDGSRGSVTSDKDEGDMRAVDRVVCGGTLAPSSPEPQPFAITQFTRGQLVMRSFSYCALLLAACGYARVYTIALHTGSTDRVHALFWLCTLLALVAILLLVRSRFRDREAALLTVLIGALFYLPKFFRSPHYFDYHDELAHWYATSQLLAGHGAFVANPDIPIVQYYPGLHVLTATLASTTGLSVFAAGNIVSAWAHAVTCLAVYCICRHFTRRPEMALIATVMFAANPAFFYFDAQFAYETLGIAFYSVILLACIRIATPSECLSWAEVGLVGFLIAALVITHHMTSYLLAGTLVALAVAYAILCRRGRISRTTLWKLAALASFAVLSSLTWLLAVARGTLAYIRGPIAADLTAFRSYLVAGAQPNPPRPLFAGGSLPIYEVYLSYASIIVLFGLYIWALVGLRKLRRDPRQWVLLLLGSMYFASLPVVFVFTDQTAKRPWAFAFIGLSVAFSPALYRLLANRHWLGWFAGLTLVTVAYVGGVVTLSGYDIRFPGAYSAASDALSTTPDLVAAAIWIDQNYGNGNPIIGDETDANVMGSYGRQDPRTYQTLGYEPWKVVFPSSLNPSVYAELRSDDARFIVIDRRIATGPANQVDYYFSSTEPDAGTGIRPFNESSLNKFQFGPFNEIYNNGNIVIWEYRDWANPLSDHEGPRP